MIVALVNSGLVTIITSAAMTYKATSSLLPSLWLVNWLISWFIVFNYVYWVAPKVSKVIQKQRY